VSGSFLHIIFSFEFDLAVFVFKFTYTLANQVYDLTIGGAALIFRNIFEFAMELRIHLDA